MTTNAEKAFRAKAPVYMDRIMSDLSIGLDDAAAVFGNLGHESGGLVALQEEKPIVKGSKGGYGWAQWTGPRRRAYEAWCNANKLSPSADEANYRYLIVELTGSEKGAVAKVKAAKTLIAKVQAFEREFERAGIKHYDSRVRWAKIALDAWNASRGEKPAPAPAPAAPSDKDLVTRVQQQLKDLGYTEVGAVDGKIGTMTATAIRAFRAENGLPEGDQIDDPLLLALQKAKPRQIAPERSDAPPEVIRDKVPEVKTNWMTKIGAFFTGVAALIGSVFDGIVGNLGSAAGYIQPVKDAAGDVPGWFWMLLIAIVAGGLYLVARHGEQKGVEAFQTGARR